MKILVICQYYYPEPFRISNICEELVKLGNIVTVITGYPNYPMGEIYPEYRNRQKKVEIINGVKVYRCYTIGRKKGKVRRVLNYYSFVYSSIFFVSKIRDRFDVVFINQLSPVMMARAGIKYKKKYNTKLILYCLDLWPESLTVSGIKKNSIIYKYYHKVSAKIYRQADKIIVSSQSFKKYFFDEFSISSDSLVYLPQYAEELFDPGKCKKQSNNMIDLMFAGNVGIMQSVDTIIHVAYKTIDIKNLKWHIVGDGSELAKCKILAKKLGVNSVIFYGRKSLKEMPSYYSMADAMILTMKDDPTLSMTLPGKLQSYMASGKTIIGAINGEAKKVIEESKCGICVSAQDIDGLTNLVRKFASNKDSYFECGAYSRKYYEKNYSKKIFINRLISYLNI